MFRVTKKHRRGDSNPELAPLAEVFKLLGTSAYSKLIEAIKHHTSVTCTKDDSAVDKALCSVWFQDLDVIDGACKIELKTARLPLITLPNQYCGLSACQAVGVGVLPGFLELLCQEARFRANPDGHRQLVRWAFMQQT